SRDLRRTLRGRRARVLVVHEAHAVADEHLVLDLDAVTDEGVAGDLAERSDDGSRLDLHEGADARVIADAAPVEVREGPDRDVLAELHLADEAERRVVCRLGGQIWPDATQFSRARRPGLRLAGSRA